MGVLKSRRMNKAMDSGDFSGFGFFWILVVVDLAVVTQTTSLRKPGEDRGPLGLRRVWWARSQKGDGLWRKIGMI